MKFRYLAALLAVLLLLAGVCTALSAAGSREDPLLTKSYVEDSFAPSVLSDAGKALAFTLGQVAAQHSGTQEVKSTGAFAIKNVGAGSTAVLELGDSVTLLSGAATVELQRGALVNVTVGAEASSGILILNHRYLACEDTLAVVSFTEASAVAVDGSVELTGSVSPFTDVLPKDWFYADVVTAVEKGLINGKTPSTYEPVSRLTLAEAVKLAACLHQLHHTGSVRLENSPSGAWYRSYVDYALQNGVLTADDYDYDKAATRRQFVEIFYRAMPESSYTEINSIADGAIPDVDAASVWAQLVYRFYRAGILTGYTGTPGFSEHAFGPDTSIARSEVAAVLTRMYDAAARKSFSLG